MSSVVSFDPTISLGTVLSFVGFLVGGLSIVFTLRSEVRGMSHRMMSVEKELQQIAEILVQLGRQDERMKAFERRLEDIRLESLARHVS